MRRAWILLLVATINGYCQLDDSRIKQRIDSLVFAEMQKDKAVGVAIGVVKNGKIWYNKGYGAKELRTNKQVDSLTNFHLASISKVFVATAIMQLVEQGRIDLDAKLLDYIPVKKLRDRRYRQITIRQMLMHTSGIPDVMYYHWRNPNNDSLALRNFARRSIRKEKLKFNPGARFRYSNRAFEILGHVIETVSQKPFDAYQSDHVLQTAGLTHSNFDFYKIDPTRKSTPHIKRFGKVKVSKVYPYNRQHGPSSTLNSCTYDMCKWIIEMLNINSDSSNTYKGVIKQGTLRDMWSPKFSLGPGASIGLTWYVVKTDLGTMVAHDGGDRGYSSMLGIYPDLKLGVIMLINCDFPTLLFELPARISWLASGNTITEVPVTEDKLKPLEGIYVSTNQPYGKRKVIIKLNNGQLTGKDDSYLYKLIPVGHGRFINPDDGSSLVFDTADPRAITMLLFGSIHLKKVD